MLSQDTSPHLDRPREQRPRSICHHQLVPEQDRRRHPDKNLPNPAAIAASPFHPEPRHLAAGDPDHPPERAGLAADPPPWASTTATSTTIPISINAGRGKQRDHHAPQCPATPATPPHPARVRQNGSRAAPAAGGTGRSALSNQPAPGHRNHARRRAIRCEASCSVSGHVARCQVAIQDRLVLVLGHVLTGAALLAGLPRPGPPTAPVMSDPDAVKLNRATSPSRWRR